jgi:hypothetical protein
MSIALSTGGHHARAQRPPPETAEYEHHDRLLVATAHKHRAHCQETVHKAGAHRLESVAVKSIAHHPNLPRAHR